MATFGVNVPEWMKEEIEAPLGYGDSRSDRIRELLRVGIVVDNTLRDREMLLAVPEGKERSDFVREAIEEKIERMEE